MKNKTLTIILLTAFIACIGVSIYQLNTTSVLKNRLSVLTNTKNELTAEIESKTTELAEIASETEEMNNTISELTTVMENLTSLTEEMQSEIKSLEEAQSIEVNSTHNDLVLGDDEYKGDEEITTEETTEEEQQAIQSIADRMMAEHPEWFDENGNIKVGGGNGGSTTQGNYEHVGTPDNGVIPEYTLGESGSEGITPGTIY